MKHKAQFITFEGLDNCGKTTQLRKLSGYLTEIGVEHIVAQEPGETALGGALRRILKNPEQSYRAFNIVFADHPDFRPLETFQQRTPQAELFLFLAARSEFIYHVVRPQLKKSVSVLADRFMDSTTAYQGGGLFEQDGKTLKLIRDAHDFILKGVGKPDLTFLLDISPAVMQQRAGSEELDYIEKRGPAYFNRVRNTYLKLQNKSSGRIKLIDGKNSVENIFNSDIVPQVRRLYRLDSAEKAS